MARYSAGTQTGAGSTTLPLASLFSSASAELNVVEIGIFNSTTTAFQASLWRYGWAAVGTVGTLITAGKIDQPSMTAQGLPYTTPASGAPTFTPLGPRTQIGAAIGAGMVWTFGGEGLVIPAAAGTVNGIAVMPAIGAGQVSDVYFIWEE